MTNITLSIDEKIKKRMKNHPEIKWTEIIRHAILDYLARLEEIDIISSQDLWNQLDSETREMIIKLDEKLDIDEEIRRQEALHAMDMKRIESIKNAEDQSDE